MRVSRKFRQGGVGAPDNFLFLISKVFHRGMDSLGKRFLGVQLLLKGGPYQYI